MSQLQPFTVQKDLKKVKNKFDLIKSMHHQTIFIADTNHFILNKKSPLYNLKGTILLVYKEHFKKQQKSNQSFSQTKLTIIKSALKRFFFFINFIQSLFSKSYLIPQSNAI